MTDDGTNDGTITVAETCRTNLMDGKLLCSYKVGVSAPGNYVIPFPRFVPEAMVGINASRVNPGTLPTNAFFDLGSRTLYVTFTGTGTIRVDLTMVGRVDVNV